MQKKVINYYRSFFEVSKKLNQEQFYLFNTAVYGVLFFEQDIEEVTFEDMMLEVVWASVKHSLKASIDGFCSKQDVSYQEILEQNLTNPLTNPLSKGGKSSSEPLTNNDKGKEKDKGKDKGKEKGKEKQDNLKVDGTVQAIFKHWQATLNHPHAKLDAKRKKRISEAIKMGYAEDELKRAIDGCSYSEFHMGKNDSKKIYDTIDLIFRDADKIDGFIAQQKPKAEEDFLKGWNGEEFVDDEPGYIDGVVVQPNYGSIEC